METALLFFGAVLIAGLSFVIGRYAFPAKPSADPAVLATAQSEITHLNQENTALRQRVESHQVELASANGTLQRTSEENARLNERIERVTELSRERNDEIAGLKAKQVADATEISRMFAEIARLQERESQQSDAQERLKTEFESIALRVLKSTSTELSEDSREKLAALIEPLRERIQEFQGKVETTFDAEKREVLSLKEQIKLIAEMSQNIGNQADRLARTLRGDSRRIGRWGELVLERVLESAGLTEGREFVTQGRGLGLKSNDGGVQRPDIIVKLPEGRAFVVDSKVPLAAYDRAIDAEDQDQQEICRNEFVCDVRTHIDALASKRYQENYKLQAHELVLMFVPIDGALMLAIQTDPELYTFAWTRRVVLVGPTNLLMTMQTVASIWRYEAQGQNAQEIARLAGDLCDKISISLEDLQAAAEKMNAALTSHNDAVKRLAHGKGNALALGDRIKSLGVKTRRPTPTIVIEGIPLSGDPNVAVEPKSLSDNIDGQLNVSQS